MVVLHHLAQSIFAEVTGVSMNSTGVNSTVVLLEWVILVIIVMNHEWIASLKCSRLVEIRALVLKQSLKSG